MQSIMKNLTALLIFLAFIVSSHALDLDTARTKKLVVELPNGYLSAADPSAGDLVKDINAKRKTHYEAVAKKSGATVEHVGQEAAKKIQEKLQTGK